MPTWLLIVLIGLGALIVIFGVGGAVVVSRRERVRAGTFDEALGETNRDLAAAHAQDNGWEPATLQAIARRHFSRVRPDATVTDMSLIQVIDPPGTDDDRAVFRFTTDAGEAELVLGRQAGEWVTESLD